MSRAPWQWADDGGAGPRHRATTGRRRGMPARSSEEEFEEIRQDARVRRGWLGYSGGTHQSRGDMEGRVHGGRPSRRYFTAAGDPCVHGGYPSRCFAAGDSSRLSQASRIREKAERVEQELHDIERSLVLPICLNPEASGSFVFPDSTRRLDRYLDAASRLLRLETFGDIDNRKKFLLSTAMSSLVEEFCRLRVWTHKTSGEHSPLASIWESVRRRRSCSSSDESSLSSSGGTSDGSCGSYRYGEEPWVQRYSAFTGMVYVDPRSASILSQVAGVMIEAKYEHLLRGAFDQHCTQLSRYVEVLDIDNIFGYHMDEPREILIQVWTSAMHTNIGFLIEMQRHLNGHDFGAFNKLKEYYFLSIAKASVMKLFNSASSICHQVDTPIDPSCENSYLAVKQDLSRMVNVVMVYQALDHVMPTISALFSGETKVLVTVECEGLVNRLSDMFAKLYIELNNLVRSQHLFITNTGVHRFTKHVMHHMRLLVQQKNTIHLMLKGDFKALSEMVTRLILSLEFTLNVNSRNFQHQGQQQIFLLNNVHFVLEEAKKNTDLGVILGESWFSLGHDKVDQCIAGYVDASWTPIMSSLERQTRFPTILWPQQLLYKFNSSFEMAYNVQKNWKVTDPSIRQKLRESIYHKVIPLYHRMHTENYSEETLKSARYSIEQLESRLLELFEG